MKDSSARPRKPGPTPTLSSQVRAHSNAYNHVNYSNPSGDLSVNIFRSHCHRFLLQESETASRVQKAGLHFGGESGEKDRKSRADCIDKCLPCLCLDTGAFFRYCIYIALF